MTRFYAVFQAFMNVYTVHKTSALPCLYVRNTAGFMSASIGELPLRLYLTMPVSERGSGFAKEAVGY